MSFKKIRECRCCKSDALKKVMSLGEQHLTGVFPKNLSEIITKGPLDLVFCRTCSLLQLSHSYDLDEMYGENYGYRSGLNASMIEHLKRKILTLENIASLNTDDLVIDIGSNDATTLNAYSANVRKIGVDPTAKKFIEHYKEDTVVIEDFFSGDEIRKITKKKAKIITSIAMFYDLEDPSSFIKDIYECLDESGIWHFEQSYMPSMLRTNSYDTICHEHLEFYSLGVVKELLEAQNFKIIDVETNSINGGSFAVTAAKKSSDYTCNYSVIDWLLGVENDMNLSSEQPFLEFSKRVARHKEHLNSLIKSLVSSGKTVFGYGASTKGNVILQYCELKSDLIPYIAEVNPEKFRSFTPGTCIPIISEEEAKKLNPDYFLVFPWHFKSFILEKEQEYRKSGGKFIFPLPEIEII